MSDRPPPEVEELVRQRAEARAARDFRRADELRDRIGELGWQVVDQRTGSTARPALPTAPAVTGYARAEDLESSIHEPAAVAVSVQIVAEGEPDDVRRCLASLAAHPPQAEWELVVVANAAEFDVATAARQFARTEPQLLSTTARLGWADARNLALRRSRGELTILIDTSVEATGDWAPALLDAFDDPTVGLAGPWGVVSDDGRQFEEARVGEVDAIEAYCMAIRRAVLREAGLFDPRFRYYRHADLDFSFQARAAGWRAVVVGDVPMRRHTHRGWESLPPSERDRLSKRNFYRFLERWRSRPDLLVRHRA